MKAYGPKKVILEAVASDGTVVEVERNLMPISESSLNRMLDHGKTGMVILSACRSAVESTDPKLDLTYEFEMDMGGRNIDSDALYDEMEEWLRKRNAVKDKELKDDIKKAGYSFTPVYGGYHGKDDVASSYEPSYVVYNYKRGDDNPGDFYELEQFAIKMCGKYGQESVYVQEPGSAPKYLDAEGNQVNMFSSNDFKLNRDDQQFFTTTKRDKANPKTFSADIVFESLYIQLRPASYNENMRRIKSGEYIL